MAGRAPPYLKLGFAKNMCLVLSPNMWQAAQSLQKQVGTRGSSNIRGHADTGFLQAWKSMPYTTYVPLQEGYGLAMTAEDLDTGGVFLLSRPDGMLLVVPPSKHHQLEAHLRHEIALAMRVLPMSEDTPGLRFAWQGEPCFSYATQEVLGHNEIPPELWVFLLKRVKWLKVPFHVAQVI